MRLNIWSPGSALHKNQEGCHLLNAMCKFTQFVVLYITTNTKSEALSKLFMEEIASSFGMILVILRRL